MRTHARAHAPGAAAFLGPGAGQLWPPPHLLDSSSPPSGNPLRGPAALQPPGRPASTPASLSQQSPRPLALALAPAPSGPPRRPFPPGAAFPRRRRFPLKDPHRAPDRGRSPTYSQRNLPGPPDVSRPRSAPRFLARRRGERAPVPRLHRGGAYHSELMREGEAEGAGAVPFAARGPGPQPAEPGCAHTYRGGSGNGMGSTGPAQCR